MENLVHPKMDEYENLFLNLDEEEINENLAVLDEDFEDIEENMVNLMVSIEIDFSNPLVSVFTTDDDS